MLVYQSVGCITPAGYHVASIDLYTISNTSSSTTGMTMRSSEVNLHLDCWSKLSQGKLKLIICSANVCIISSETRHGSSSSGWYFVYVNVNGDKRPVFCKCAFLVVQDFFDQ